MNRNASGEQGRGGRVKGSAESEAISGQGAGQVECFAVCFVSSLN